MEGPGDSSEVTQEAGGEAGLLPGPSVMAPQARGVQLALGTCGWLKCVPQKTHLGPESWHLRLRSYLDIGSLQVESG